MPRTSVFPWGVENEEDTPSAHDMHVVRLADGSLEAGLVVTWTNIHFIPTSCIADVKRSLK